MNHDRRIKASWVTPLTSMLCCANIIWRECAWLCMLRQLELMSLDQRTQQSTVALTLLRSPVQQVPQAIPGWTTAQPIPTIPPSPFAFAVSSNAASEPEPTISPSAAAKALSEHMTPEMRQNLRDMAPEDFKKGISSVFGL